MAPCASTCFWMMGSLAYGSQQLGWWWLVLPLTLGWLCWQGKALQQLLLGETQARLMGLDVGQDAGAAGAGGPVCSPAWRYPCAVSSVSSDWWWPHLLRLCGGSDQRFLLPASALGGRRPCCWGPIWWRARP